MVKFCAECEVSYNEGESCDCGAYLVCNGDITDHGIIAFRYEADRAAMALWKFLRDGRWNGVDSVDVLALRIESDECRWGQTYNLEGAEWNEVGFVTRPLSGRRDMFNIHGPLEVRIL